MSTYTASQAADIIVDEGFNRADVDAVIDTLIDTMAPNEYDEDAEEWLLTDEYIELVKDQLNSGAGKL